MKFSIYVINPWIWVGNHIPGSGSGCNESRSTTLLQIHIKNCYEYFFSSSRLKRDCFRHASSIITYTVFKKISHTALHKGPNYDRFKTHLECNFYTSQWCIIQEVFRGLHNQVELANCMKEICLSNRMYKSPVLLGMLIKSATQCAQHTSCCEYSQFNRTSMRVIFHIPREMGGWI